MRFSLVFAFLALAVVLASAHQDLGKPNNATATDKSKRKGKRKRSVVLFRAAKVKEEVFPHCLNMQNTRLFNLRVLAEKAPI